MKYMKQQEVMQLHKVADNENYPASVREAAKQELDDTVMERFEALPAGAVVMVWIGDKPLSQSVATRYLTVTDHSLIQCDDRSLSGPCKCERLKTIPLDRPGDLRVKLKPYCPHGGLNKLRDFMVISYDSRELAQELEEAHEMAE